MASFHPLSLLDEPFWLCNTVQGIKRILDSYSKARHSRKNELVAEATQLELKVSWSYIEGRCNSFPEGTAEPMQKVHETMRKMYNENWLKRPNASIPSAAAAPQVPAPAPLPQPQPAPVVNDPNARRPIIRDIKVLYHHNGGTTPKCYPVKDVVLLPNDRPQSNIRQLNVANFSRTIVESLDLTFAKGTITSIFIKSKVSYAEDKFYVVLTPVLRLTGGYNEEAKVMDDDEVPEDRSFNLTAPDGLPIAVDIMLSHIPINLRGNTWFLTLDIEEQWGAAVFESAKADAIAEYKEIINSKKKGSRDEKKYQAMGWILHNFQDDPAIEAMAHIAEHRGCSFKWMMELAGLESRISREWNRSGKHQDKIKILTPDDQVKTVKNQMSTWSDFPGDRQPYLKLLNECGGTTWDHIVSFRKSVQEYCREDPVRQARIQRWLKDGMLERHGPKFEDTDDDEIESDQLIFGVSGWDKHMKKLWDICNIDRQSLDEGE